VHPRGLARLMSRINRRISSSTFGLPPRRLDFQRQNDRNPARCQRITVSGRTMASASTMPGMRRYNPTNTNRSILPNTSLFGDRGRRSTSPLRKHLTLLRLGLHAAGCFEEIQYAGRRKGRPLFRGLYPTRHIELASEFLCSIGDNAANRRRKNGWLISRKCYAGCPAKVVVAKRTIPET
jgi:hypothetical protein